MSSWEPSAGREANARNMQNRQMVLGFDLNTAISEVRVVPADPGLIAPDNENLHLQAVGDAELDDVVEISPRKFEEARKNFRRKPTFRSRGPRQVLFEAIERIPELKADTGSYPVSDKLRETSEDQANVDTELRLRIGDSRKAKKTDVLASPMQPPSEHLPKGPTFSCSVCMGQLIEETSTKCGHIFCKKCIEAAIATQNKCPNCRRKLRKYDIFRVYLPTSN